VIFGADYFSATTTATKRSMNNNSTKGDKDEVLLFKY